MTADALARLAAGYSSLAAVGLLIILTMIARFYQRQARVNSGYRFFLLPALLFLLAGARYVFVRGAMAGDLLGDLARLTGGLVLFGEGAYLLRLMTGRPK